MQLIQLDLSLVAQIQQMDDGGTQLYDPEDCNVFEIGMKNTLMDGSCS